MTIEIETKKGHEEQVSICPDCHSKNLKVSGLDTVCIDCGRIISTDNIDNKRDETRWFGDSDEKEGVERSRLGPKFSSLYPDRSTVFGTIAFNTKSSIPEKQAKFKRLSKLDKSHNSKVTRLERHLGILRHYADVLNIPRSVAETAATYLKTMIDEDAVLGRKCDTTATALLYLACRTSGVPIDINVFIKASDSSKPSFNDCYRKYRLLLEGRIGENGSLKVQDYSIFLDKLVDMFHTDQEVRRLARKALDLAHERKITSGKNPKSCAAAAFWWANIYYHKNIDNYDEVTQRRVADRIQITEVTLRNRYRDMNPVFEELEATLKIRIS